MTAEPAPRRAPADRRRPWMAALLFLVLLGLAAIALPISAWIVEGISERAENWILPLQAVLVTLVAVGYRLLRSTGGGAGRDVVVGVGAAVAAVLIADAIWLFGIAG